MIPRDGVEVVERLWPGLVAAAMVAGLVWRKGEWLVRFVVLPLFRLVRAVMNGFAENALLRERLDGQGRALERIEAQLVPNGGSSFRDALDQFRRDVTWMGARMDALLSASAVAHFETDANGACTYVNDAYLRLVMRSRREVLGANWEITIAQELREMVVEAWLDAVKEQRIFEMRYDYVRPDGQRVHALVRADPVTDAKGVLIGYRGHVTPQ